MAEERCSFNPTVTQIAACFNGFMIYTVCSDSEVQLPGLQVLKCNTFCKELSA